MKKASSYSIVCPKCQCDKIIPHGKRYTLYPSGCLALFALPLAWVHRESTPHDFECHVCGQRFSKCTTCARIAYGGLWLSGGVIVCWIMRMILGSA